MSVPTTTPLRRNSTCVTEPLASAAVAAIEKAVPVTTLAPFAGLVMETVGAMGASKKAKLNMSSPFVAPFWSTGVAVVLTMSRLSMA